MLIGTDQAQIWRELERIEQRLSRGVDSAASQLYDSMGRPATQAFTNFGNHFALGLARVDRVRQALDQSGPMARRMVEQQLSGIGIATVWDILVAACKEIALYYGGAVVTGAALGGAIGSAAFGVGAVPGAVIGTAAGAQVGTWVMALMGLKELAEGLAGMLPAALDHYERGFREAWGAAPEERRDTWRSTIPASGNTYTAAWHLSQGHAIMVGAILTALVAYLTRGRGNKAGLLQDIRNSPRLGPKFAEWLTENERKLLGHPQLKTRPTTPVGQPIGASLPANGRNMSSAKSSSRVGVGGANKAVASKLSFDSSLNTVDRSFSVKAGEILAENPVGSASYARLQRQGTIVRFVNDQDMHAMGYFDAYNNSVTVNMLRHSSAEEAASTIVHEATHQNGFYRGIAQNTQFTEYQAFRNESLFMNGTRPSLAERINIWNDVKSLYPDLPEGKNPFGGRK